MLTAQQFVRAWGTEDLVRFPQELVEAIDIPEEAKIFLIEAGLPRRAKFSYEFILAPVRVASKQTLSGGMTYPLLPLYPRSRCRVLSHRIKEPRTDLHLPWRILIEEETGHIWSAYRDEAPSELTHSSVMQYAEALLDYRDFIDSFRPDYPDAEEITLLLTELARRLRESDPIAMDDPPAIANLHALWWTRLPSRLSRVEAQSAFDALVGEDIPELTDGPKRFWPRELIDMTRNI